MIQSVKKENTHLKTKGIHKNQVNNLVDADDELNDFLNAMDSMADPQDGQDVSEDRPKYKNVIEIDGQLYYDPDEEDSDDDPDEEDSDYDSDEQAWQFEQSLAFLDDMVGMEHVKQKLLRLGRYAQWKKKLEAVGIDTSVYPQPNLTFMFLGAPGTGKTTVAKQMGKVLKSIGLLSDDFVHVFRREDLVGQNYGCEEENTKAALKESRGAVFFLDEAYQCFKQSSDKRDPGYHILETMMQHFDRPGRCIIMAGYTTEMMELFKVNPGFRSRIPDENIIEFTGPSEQMLLDVAAGAFRRMSFEVSHEADAMLRQHIHGMWVSRDKDFGNARVIRQLAESVVINHANRIMTTTMCDDFTISESDMQQSLTQPQQKSPACPRIGFTSYDDASPLAAPAAR